jgi:hypothetical protein
VSANHLELRNKLSMLLANTITILTNNTLTEEMWILLKEKRHALIWLKLKNNPN